MTGPSPSNLPRRISTSASSRDHVIAAWSAGGAISGSSRASGHRARNWFSRSAGIQSLAWGAIRSATRPSRAKASPFANFFGREERVRRLAQGLGIHSVSGVADDQAHVLPIWGFASRASFQLIGLDPQRSPFGHGIARIEDEIEHGKLDLIPIHKRERQCLLVDRCAVQSEFQSSVR